MSRSLHTSPRPVRAARRALDPFAPRRVGDGTPGSVPRAPRITSSRRRPGSVRPLRPADIRPVLEELGPDASYGLRAVELAGGDAGLRFGRLLVPGRIRLFDQPSPPWHVPAGLSDPAVARLAAAGAVVEPALGGHLVHWPAGRLRAFFLLDVLLHELGHHRVQHEKGKRAARTLRTADHEHAASVHAARWRARLADRFGPL